jgi:hypothetical protein
MTAGSDLGAALGAALAARPGFRALYPGLRHAVAAADQLVSYNADGPTLYGLAVTGPDRAAARSVLVGPAVAPAGVTDDWPEPMRPTAVNLLAAQGPGRGAGTVILILSVGIGAEGALDVLISPPRAPAPGGAETAASCVAAVLGCGAAPRSGS